MTVGRVVGDRINHRIGPVALLRWGALLTGIPLGAMLLSASRQPRWPACSSSASASPTACR